MSDPLGRATFTSISALLHTICRMTEGHANPDPDVVHAFALVARATARAGQLAEAARPPAGPSIVAGLVTASDPDAYLDDACSRVAAAAVAKAQHQVMVDAAAAARDRVVQLWRGGGLGDRVVRVMLRPAHDAIVGELVDLAPTVAGLDESAALRSDEQVRTAYLHSLDLKRRYNEIVQAGVRIRSVHALDPAGDYEQYRRGLHVAQRVGWWQALTDAEPWMPTIDDLDALAAGAGVERWAAMPSVAEVEAEERAKAEASHGSSKALVMPG
jgi:hypothetical protein